MSETEQKPLLNTESEAVPPHPPPAYKPVESDVDEVHTQAHKYSANMPLPTYEQSEKYETEGVLDYHQQKGIDEEEEEEEEMEQTVEVPQVIAGTWCEFILFFLICSTLSVVGFIFAICVASTVAAQGGAVAGLGIALLSKPILFEMYDVNTVRSQVEVNYCHGNDQSSTDTCVNRVYTIAQVCFWLIGLFGVFLFYKGTAAFLKARNATSR